MNGAPAEMPAPGLAEPKPAGRNWSRPQFILLIALVFLAHVVLLIFFGAAKPPSPLAVSNAPELSLARAADELVALSDPALFALPNPRDFASAIWQQAPVIAQPSFRWTETPRWLPPAASHFGAAFNQFMQTNQFSELRLIFKPAAPFTTEFAPVASALPSTSTLQITGELARRRLLTPPTLPSLPLNDVIPPSKVQVLVDRAGGVISAVLLPSENAIEAVGRSEIGDSTGLVLARSLRFAPAAKLTFGEIIFNWRTLATTNTP